MNILRPKVILFGFVALSLSACAARKKEVPVEPPAKIPQLIGKVAMVNEDLRFVLIDAFLIPEVDTELRVVDEAGQTTARLTVSREKNPPFLIGNTIEGTPQRGEKVFVP